MATNNGHITSANNLSITEAKGDLIVGGSTGQASTIGVGLDGQVLIADSTQSNGLKWDNLNLGINYIKETDGQQLGAWTTYKNADQAQPVTGTGNSPTAPTVTFVDSTDSSMRDTTNFLFTHGASNQRGEGFSYLCAIDPSDRGSVIRFGFEYLVSSGTYADGDLTVWFYDVTNAQVIQGAPTSILNSGIIETFQSEVQVPISCAQMRVIVHVSSSTATAYTMRFDNFAFGPQEKSYGSLETDWIPFTPTGSWVTTTTYTGYWRRVGDSMRIRVRIVLSGAATATPLTINLPSGYSINTAKIPAGNPVLGLATATDVGVQNYTGIAIYQSATTVGFLTNQTNLWSNTVPFSWNNTDLATFEYEVPILGWSSSSQVVSSEETGRVIAAKASATTGTIANGGTAQIVPLSTLNVNQGGWTLTTGVSANLVVLVAGTYKISTQVGYTAAATGLQTVGYKVNAGTAVILGSLSAPAQYNTIVGNDLVDLKAGDVVYMIAQNNHSTSLTIDVAKLNIERLSGPSQIMAGETIAASYGVINQSVPVVDAVALAFTTKKFDTHGIYVDGSGYTPGTGVWGSRPRFVFNRAGKYRVSWCAGINVPAGVNASFFVQANLYNSAGSSLLKVAGVRLNNNVALTDLLTSVGSTTFEVLVGDFVCIEMYQNTGAARNTNTEFRFGYVSIESVGL